MRIETTRLLLRPLTAADAPVLFRAVGDAEVMRYWAGGADASIAATERRIAEQARHWETYGFGDWGVVERASGRVIGMSGLHHLDEMADVNIGYAFERRAWRQGFAFEAGQAVLDVGFQTLGLESIVAVIWPENTASIRLAEKLGLRFWRALTWGGGARVVYRVTTSLPGPLPQRGRGS